MFSVFTSDHLSICIYFSPELPRNVMIQNLFSQYLLNVSNGRKSAQLSPESDMQIKMNNAKRVAKNLNQYLLFACMGLCVCVRARSFNKTTLTVLY